MPAYISEIHYDGNKNVDFFEIAVPEGTDVSGYTLSFYDVGGNSYVTTSLGTPIQTQYGYDIYVVDNSTITLPDSRSGHGIALSDGDGTVIQFVSYGDSPSTITGINGAADGLTSTYIGAASSGSTLETTDGGATYSVQSTPSSGSIPGAPICYAPGTLIDTPDGLRAVETLRPGDPVLTMDRGAQPIRWVRSSDHPLDDVREKNKPVLIQASALGPGRPARDLIVSPQHRVLVGGGGQLQGYFKEEVFVPAKSLIELPGIRHMKGKTAITWIHFACDNHEVVVANGCFSESLLLGPMVLGGLTQAERQSLIDIYGSVQRTGEAKNGPAARASKTVGHVRRILAKGLNENKNRTACQGVEYRSGDGTI